MADAKTHEEPNAARYRTGIAARLAGIPVETLRVWERRYGVVSPRLSPRGQRLYSAEEVRRLALIKQLLDMGHPIGSVATLPTDALVTMREGAHMLAAAAADDDIGALRIALVGPVISSRRLEDTFSREAASRASSRELNIVGRCMNAQDAADALRAITADIVVIELPTLNDASIATVADVKGYCGARQAIVLYRFAPNVIIRRLREAGHEVARAPSDAAEIASLCRTLLRLPTAPPIRAENPVDSKAPPPPRFDERALVTLADASPTIYCECPRHLVDLVLSLSSFERYSAECANRGPDDAALHRDLEYSAGRARVLIEDALLRVAVIEGLTIPRTDVA
jgi:hypothetical protein